MASIGPVCLVPTKQIKALAKKAGISNELATIEVSLWQEANKRDMNAYPTDDELKEFIEKRNRSKIRTVKFSQDIPLDGDANSLVKVLTSPEIRNLASSMGITFEVSKGQKEDDSRTETAVGIKEMETKKKVKVTMRISGEFVTELDKMLFISYLKDMGYVNADMFADGYDDKSRLEIYTKWEEKAKEEISRKKRDPRDLQINLERIGRIKNDLHVKIQSDFVWRRSKVVQQWIGNKNKYRSAVHDMAWSFSQKLTQMYNEDIAEKKGRAAEIRRQLGKINSDLKKSLTEEQRKKLQGKTGKLVEELDKIEDYLDSTSRRDYMMKINPKTVFANVIKDWRKLLELYKSGNIEEAIAFHKTLAPNFGVDKIRKNPQALIDNFEKRLADGCYDSIILDATQELKTTELIDLNIVNVNDAMILNDDWVNAHDGEHDERGFESKMEDDDHVLENWQYEIDNVSQWAKLGTQLRNMLSTIPKYRWKTGFGAPIYWDASKIVGDLTRMLEGCMTFEDMVTKMKTQTSLKPYLSDIISRLQSDNQLRAIFFQKFSNCQHLYAVMNTADGTINIVNLRDDRNMQSELQIEQENNVKQGIVLAGEYSCYDNTGKIDMDGVIRTWEKLHQLETGIFYGGSYGSILQKLNAEQLKDFFEKNTTEKYNPFTQVIDTIFLASKSIGLNLDRSKIYESFFSKSGKSSCISILYGKIYDVIDELHSMRDSKAIRDTQLYDMLYFKKQKGSIMLSEIISKLLKYLPGEAQIVVENGFQENGKYYYSLTNMSRLDKVMLAMQGKIYTGDKEKYIEGYKDSASAMIDMFGKDDPFFFYTNHEGKLCGWNAWMNTLIQGGNKCPPILVQKKDGGRPVFENGKPVMEELFPYDFTDNTGQWNYVKILNASVPGQEAPVEYGKWTQQTWRDMVWQAYDNKSPYDNDSPNKNTEKGAWYPLFPTSDTQAMYFIHAPKYLSQALDFYAAKIAEQELERMIRVDSMRNVPACYKIRGKLFLYLEECNFFEGGDTKEEGAKRVLDKYLSMNEEERADYCSQLGKYWLQKKVDNDILFKSKKNLSAEDAGKYELFIKNQAYAQVCMRQIFLGDLAFYPSEKDVMKRCKELIVPKSWVDPTNPNGMKEQNVVYIDDIICDSTAFKELSAIVEKHYKDKKISKETYENTINGLKGIKTTDGQSYRSFKSMLRLLMARGVIKIGDDAYNALIRISQGKGSPKDYKIAKGTMPAVKSFTTGLQRIYTGNGQEANMPYMLKLSEQVLVSAEMNGAMLASSSPVLRALASIANDYWTTDLKRIDWFVFKSAVKTGNNGNITLHIDPNKGFGLKGNDMKNAVKEIKDDIIEQITNPVTGVSNQNIHTIPTSDYGIVSEVHDETLDGDVLAGSQILKLIEANMPGNDAVFTVGGKKMHTNEIVQLYHNLIIEILSRKFKELYHVMIDTEKLAAKLRESARASTRGGDTLSGMFEVDENGKFLVPLTNMSTLRISSEFINSLIRKELTKIHFAGGHYVQASNFGFNENLTITFDKDGNMVVPCYLPVWSRELIRKYMDEKGNVDINAINNDCPDILEMFGFRIPTEGKHFAMNLKVVGFLPQISGSTIILPSDIITFTDSDFDIDKIFLMMPEIETEKYDREQARDDYNNLNKGKDEELTDEKFETWFAENKKEYMLDPSQWKISKIKFDYDDYRKNHNLENFSDKQIRNAIVDVMRAMVSSPAVSEQTIISGGIEEAKKVASEMRSITGVDYSKMPLCDVNTVIKQRISNNDGKEMIAIAAVANAMHAICQHTNLGLAPGLSVNMFGKELSSLHELKTDGSADYITQVLGTVIGASADNINEPTLSYLGINPQTKGVAMLLLRMGFSLRQVSLFLNMDSIQQYSNGNTIYQIAENIRNGVYSKDNLYLNFNYSEEDIINAIKNHRTRGYSIEDPDDFARAQAQINSGPRELKAIEEDALNVFISLRAIASQLFDIDSLTRNDTGAGVPIGPIEKNVYRMVKYITTIKKLSDTSKCFFNDAWKTMFDIGSDFDKAIKNSPIPVSQAYTSFVARGGFDIFSELFPGFKLAVPGEKSDAANSKFLEVIASTAIKVFGTNVKEEDIKRIMTNLFIYSQSQFSCFNKSGMTSEESRNWYINIFPEKAKDIIQRYNSRIGGFSFIKHLLCTDPTSNYNSRFFITFNYEGRPNNELRDAMSDEWEQLLGMGDELKEFAIDLFKYSFWRNGLQFGNKTFAHLAPLGVVLAIPGYVKTLQAFTDGYIGNNFNEEQWYVEFLRNNLRDKIICKEINLQKFSSIVPAGQKSDIVELSQDMLNGFNPFRYYCYFKDIYTDFNGVRHGTPRDLFKLDKDYYILKTIDGNGTAIYQKTTPLGFGFEAREYNADPKIDPFDVKTVYDQDAYSARPKRRLWNQFTKFSAKERVKRIEAAIEVIKKSIADEKDEVMKKVYNKKLEKLNADLKEAKEKMKNRKMKTKAEKVKDKLKSENELKADFFGQIIKEITLQKKYVRSEAEDDKKNLYIFLDNGDRTSGQIDVDPNSLYFKKYSNGNQLKYPEKATSATVRGLANAFPLTLFKKYTKGDIEGNKWTDNDIDKFTLVIHNDVDAIIKAFDDGDYDHVVFPLSSTDGAEDIFGGKLADITKERTPKLRKILEDEIERLKDGIVYEDEGGSGNDGQNGTESEQGNDSAIVAGIGGNTMSGRQNDDGKYDISDEIKPEERSGYISAIKESDPKHATFWTTRAPIVPTKPGIYWKRITNMEREKWTESRFAGKSTSEIQDILLREWLIKEKLRLFGANPKTPMDEKGNSIC